MTKSRSDKDIILIVDDQPENLQILAAILAEQGYEVQQALNGRLALKAAQELLPDLILLDVRLPDMSGYKVCERLKADESTRDIPIIFVSVVGETEDKVKAFAAGGVDYMTKPLQVEEVLARVETHLALRTMRRQLEEKNAQLEREIDERRQAEEALKSSREQLELITDKMPVLLAYVDSEQCYLYVNQPYADWYGRSKEDIIGRRVKDVLPETSYQGAAKHIKAVLRGQAVSFENIAPDLNGQTRVVKAVYVPHFDEHGGVKAFLAVVEDITERRRAEEALRIRDNAIASSVTAMAIAEFAGNLTYVNPAFLRMWGYDDESEALGRPAVEFWQTKEKDREVIKVLRTGDSWTGELVAKRKDGVLFNVHLSASIVTDETGDPTCMMASFVDITERVRTEAVRRQAEEALRESEERYRAIFEQAADSIVLIDAETGALVEFNDRAHENLGYTREEFEKLKIPDFEIIESADGVAKHLEKVIKEGIDTFETKQRTKSGEVREILISARAISVRGKRFVQGIWRDITERKQLEEQLRQQERLAAIGQLAGGIAHDFNNLLTSIMLYAQILKSKPHFPPDLAPNVETILDESRHAAKLVQQILDFGRRSMIETRPVDLVPLVQKTAEILRRALPENIHLVLDIGTGEHSVHADPTRIEQVVMNLATNARDAMPEGGELRIGLSRVQVKREKDAPLAGMPVGEWVCLVVSDSGTGMTEDVRQHLFEPFFTTKPPGEGTGLGLAQVYGIVKQHEGHIGVETEAGRGTTFRVCLPIHRGATEEATRGTTALPKGKGETILLVEDEERLREVGREILESLGYRVLTAEDGHEALETYRSAADIDLVITDLVMPAMGGVQLIQELKRLNPHVRALAITGYALTADKRELKEAGLLDVVHKPFDAGTLGETVRRILDTAR